MQVHEDLWASANSLDEQSGAWKGYDQKLMTSGSEEEACGQTSLNGGKKVKIFEFHVNADQRVISAEEDFNNPMDRMTLSFSGYESASFPCHLCHCLVGL